MEYKFDRIVVAGAGGVGYWLLWALCRMIGKDLKIEVYDPDTFEGGNGFRRLPRPAQKKLYKVDLLRGEIAFVMGDTPPIVYPKLLTPAEFEKGNWSKTLVLDCTDMGQRAREEFWDALDKSGAKGLRVSYDGLGVATVSPGPPMVTGAADSEDGGYAIMPHIGQSYLAAGAGACAVMYYLQTGKPLEFQLHVPTPETPSLEIKEWEDEPGN